MPFRCTLVDFLHIYIECISTLLNLEKMSHHNITCSLLREYIYQNPLPLLAVATAVAKEVDLTVLGPSTVPVVKRGLPENVAKEVQDFYLQDDIT